MMQTKALTAARAKGAMAYALKRPPTDNPYQRGNWGRGFKRAWLDGYRGAKFKTDQRPLSCDDVGHDFVMAAEDPSVDECTRCGVKRF